MIFKKEWRISGKGDVYLEEYRSECKISFRQAIILDRLRMIRFRAELEAESSRFQARA